MIRFLDNPEVEEFVNKAQNNIADLASLLVQRGGDLPSALHLLLELSDFIECLDDADNISEEEDIIRWIHGYNHRANLNAIAYLAMTGIEVNIVRGVGIQLPITTLDISDYVASTNALIRAFPHNNLSLIQPLPGYRGYSINERYHVNKDMYDKLYELTYPVQFTDPSVSIVVTPSSNPSPFGVFELGTTITNVDIAGSFVPNSGKSILYYKYNKNGQSLSAPVNNPPVANPVLSYTDSNITATTSYTFETSFQDGGIKTASSEIRFVQPMFYGTKERNLVDFSLPTTYAKVVRDRGTMDLTFTLPVGNTLITDGTDKTCVVVFPRAWGRPSSIKVGTYEFVTDWTFVDRSYTPAGSGLTFLTTVGTFNNTIEGTVIFNFSF